MSRQSGPHCKLQASGQKVYFFFTPPERNFSRAETMEGACGRGAFISSVRPASSTAREVLLPKAPILVPFCLNLGSLSKRLLTPLGVKKQMTSYSPFSINSLISLLMERYMKGVANSQLLFFSQLTISLSC